MSLLTRVFDAFIPAALRGSEITFARAKSLVALTVASALAGPSFIGVYLWLGHPGAAWAIAATLLLLPVIWVSMNVFHSLRLAQVANLLGFCALYTYLVWSTGGQPSATVPLIAAFSGGPVFGAIGTVCAVAILGGLQLAQLAGASFPANPVTDPTLQGAISTLGLVPFVGVLAIGSQLAKEQGDRLRQVRLATIESLMAEVGAQSAQVGRSVQEMVEALGHNVPRIFMLVFGAGAALAGLAGVIGGNAFVTEPAMAAAVGSIIFVVVVVGGMDATARPEYYIDRGADVMYAERFGVSRTIARQALGQLAGEGLVELRRNRIAVVATPSWAEARDTFDVRISLERLVVARLAGQLTPAQQAALHHLEGFRLVRPGLGARHGRGGRRRRRVRRGDRGPCRGRCRGRHRR